MDTAEYETNALVVNNISSVAYSFYEPVSPPPASFGPGALEIEGALRQDGHLVHVDLIRRGLWWFRLNRKDVQPETLSFPKTISICGYNLSLAEENTYEPACLARNRPYGPNAGNTPNSSSSSASGALEMMLRNPQFMAVDQPLDAKGPVSTSIREAHEHLILAVLSAMSSALSAQAGAIPLNSRTLLLPRDMETRSNYPSAPILACLRAYLTTTGVLVSAVSLSFVEGLLNLSDSVALPPLGATVLAAPLGWFATYQAVADSVHSSSESAVGQSPDTQVLRLRPERDDKSQSWRSMCAKLLQARDIHSPISGTQKWLGLQRVHRKPLEHKFDGKRTPMVNSPPNMSWPSTLCFCKAFSTLSVTGGSEEAAPRSPDRSYDPLSLARTWFLGAGERDELLAKKKKEREALAPREPTLPDGQPQHTNGLSPLALHRPVNTGAPVGAMYPTPPDGVQNLVGATPSMDETVSSPGNNAATTAMVDIDTTLNVPRDSFHDSWDNSGVKPERAGHSFEPENLFGDLGPDVFGDNNITDADFSFFDEQPGDMDLTLDLPDMSAPDRTLDMSTNLGMVQMPGIKTESVEAPAAIAPPSSVFTKPELRHARSSLLEEPRRSQESDSSRQRPAGLKRPPSPFTPDTVFKRIRASLDNRRAAQLNSQLHVFHADSRFERVDFGPTLSMVNSKYEGGRFDFSASRSHETKPLALNAPPTTDYLRRHGKGRRNIREPPANVGELWARMANGPDPSSQHPSPTKMDDPPSDADEISLVSDQDDDSYDSEEPTSPIKPASIARRRADDDGASLAPSFKDLDYIDTSSPYLSVDFPQFSKSDIELPLTKYFADPEPPSSQLPLPDSDFIMAAQILTDQASTSTLCITPGLKMTLQSQLDRRRDLLSITQRSIRDVRSMLPASLGEAAEYAFRSFIEIQDVPLLGQPTRLPARPPGADQMKPNNLWQISSPHFEMRRYENKLSVLPSAVTFWESLALGPPNGTKDITSVCIFPDFQGVKDDVEGFLDRMHSVYESLKLGSFSRLTASVDVPNGLLPYQIEKANEAFHGTASILGNGLFERLLKLSEVLSHMQVKATNFVIYFVCTPGAIVKSCYAFHHLQERYKKLVASSRKPGESILALQLVPMDFVASSSSLVTPSPVDFARLAVETYDRCSFFEGATPSPALVLEQTLPRVIDFKMSSNPSASLLHENICLHLAYAQSIDERWVAAAWTDNRGSQQMTSSYCLGRKGKMLATPLADVIQEMWETTFELISGLKVQWRLIVTKCGVMEQSEIDQWSSLAQMESKTESKASVTLALLTVDTDPSLQLIPPAVKVPSSAPSVFYTTPVSTPQPSMSILSPEQPPTPSLRDNNASSDQPTESDADATLVDVTDQTWGAILSHRLCTSSVSCGGGNGNSNSSSASSSTSSPTDPPTVPTAIVSGYLVKRTGARPEDPPAVLEVNIVHSEGNPRAYETLLREMLTYFRGLGTLARARGLVDRDVDVRPWHVAAAEKGARALYMLM